MRLRCPTHTLGRWKPQIAADGGQVFFASWDLDAGAPLALGLDDACSDFPTSLLVERKSTCAKLVGDTQGLHAGNVCCGKAGAGFNGPVTEVYRCDSVDAARPCTGYGRLVEGRCCYVLQSWGLDTVCGQLFAFSGTFAAGRASDRDGDGWRDVWDNCVGVVNFSQADRDQDGVGDACEIDAGTQSP